MDAETLEQKIDYLLKSNNREISNKFNRFRGELFVLEHYYDKDPIDLTNDQIRRLSALEKKLALMRLGFSASLASMGGFSYIVTSSAISDYKESTLPIKNFLLAMSYGASILSVGGMALGASIFGYLGYCTYKKSREVIKSIK